MDAVNILCNYFNTLHNTGSIDKCEESTLLSYICVDNFLNSGLFKWATEEDINIMGAVLNKLKSQSCLVGNATTSLVAPYARHAFIRPIMDVTQFNKVLVELYNLMKSGKNFFIVK